MREKIIVKEKEKNNNNLIVELLLNLSLTTLYDYAFMRLVNREEIVNND